jgi:2-haloacid dehalogenase
LRAAPEGAGSDRSVRAVLFDYGNVLVRWSPRDLYARLIPDPDRLEFFLAEVCPLSWHHQHDEGRPMAVTIPERQAQFPDFAEEIAAWQTRFGETVREPIAGSLALSDALIARGIPQYVLTNMPDEVVDVCFAPIADAATRFADVIVSGREKVAKPDPAIYHLALARMGGLAPHQVLFTDDNPPNIAAADALGFHTHLFEGPDGLWAKARALGLVDQA